MLKILLIILVILSTGCSTITQGTIVKKWHEPASIHIRTVPVTKMNGKEKYTHYEPHTIYDGEDFVAEIKGVHKGIIVTKKVYLTKYNYMMAKVGDILYIGKTCSEMDFTYRIEKD